MDAAVINNGLATLIRALLFDETVDIAKVQPPDGVVLRLADGTRWSIQAYRLRDEQKRIFKDWSNR